MKVFIKMLFIAFFIFSLTLTGLYLKAAIDYHNRSPLEVISAAADGISLDLDVG